jgi:hypothetical protein
LENSARRLSVVLAAVGLCLPLAAHAQPQEDVRKMLLGQYVVAVAVDTCDRDITKEQEKRLDLAEKQKAFLRRNEAGDRADLRESLLKITDSSLIAGRPTIVAGNPRQPASIVVKNAGFVIDAGIESTCLNSEMAGNLRTPARDTPQLRLYRSADARRGVIAPRQIW